MFSLPTNVFWIRTTWAWFSCKQEIPNHTTSDNRVAVGYRLGSKRVPRLSNKLGGDLWTKLTFHRTHKIFDSFIHVDSSCWNGSQSSCRKNIIMVLLIMLTTTQHRWNTSCALGSSAVDLSWSERYHSWLFVHALVGGSEKRTTHLLCSQCQSDLRASASGSLQRMGHEVRGQRLISVKSKERAQEVCEGEILCSVPSNSSRYRGMRCIGQSM